MYVCICNAIRECEFRRAARQTSGDAESIYVMLGKPPKCRQCLEEAEELLIEEREVARSVSLAVA